MTIRAAAAVAVLVWSALAAAAELAIAPVTTGQTAPELQPTFADELPRALTSAGFSLMPPNEVDMKISERPVFLQCRSGGCLAELAAYLGVARLALPRLERAPDGTCTVGITIYDARQNAPVAEGVDRVASAGEMHVKLSALAARLHADLARPGRLEVSSRPPAKIFVDREPKGTTPWAGELSPGHHVVTLEAGADRVERDVDVAAGATARVDVELAAEPERTSSRPGALKPLKWITFAGGLAALGVGGVLYALDGHGTCTPMSGQRQCPDVYDTRTGGIAALAAGGALVVTSVILFVVDRPRR